jgi:Xaa-Pro aminopeptidase
MTDTTVRPPDAIAGIGAAEYDERARRLRELASRRGLDGVVVAGRGGGPFERHANVQYLTGHYPTFPTIPDVPGHWRLRGHAFAIVGPDRLILLTDDEPGGVALHADEVRQSSDGVQAIADAIRDAGLGGKRVGLVGSDVLSRRHDAALAALAGELPEADDLLAGLRLVKSPAEQELLRAAGRVGSAAITAALAAAEVGATTQEAAAAATASAVAAGAAVANVFAGTYGPDRPARRRAFPAYADDAPMRSGDVFAIDMSGSLDGYFFDFSRARVVGDDLHGGEAALATAQRVVEETVAALRPGSTVADAARVGYDVMAQLGDDLRDGGFDALGHGLGLGFEDPWVTTDNDTPLVAGMCIAIEKFVSRGPVCAAFEHNVLVTGGAPEVLSGAPDRYGAS